MSPADSNYANKIINTYQRFVNRSTYQQSVSGSQMAGQIDPIYSVKTGLRNTGYSMLGFNDVRFYGADTTGVSTYRSGLYSMLGWFCVPDTNKDFAVRNATDYSFVGAWANATVTPVSTGYATNSTKTQNDSLIYNFTGPVVYFASWLSNDSGAVYTVAVDGVLKETVQGKKYKDPATAPAFSPSLVRVAGLTDAAHSLTVKKTDATGTYLWAHWAGTNAVKGARFILANIPLMNAYGYSLNAPTYNKGSTTIDSSYNAIIDTAKTAFMADGFPVYGIDASALINVHTDILGDSVHLNQSGNNKLFNAISDTINAHW